MNKTLTKKDWDFEDFHFQVALGFIDQCEMEMARRELKRKDLAANLGVTESYISQIFNNPANLTLKTISRIARNFGEKASVVLYDDNDPTNQKGALSPMVFVECWNLMGKPANQWEVERYAEGVQLQLFNSASVYINQHIECTKGKPERASLKGAQEQQPPIREHTSKQSQSLGDAFCLGTEATTRSPYDFAELPQCPNILVKPKSEWGKHVYR